MDYTVSENMEPRDLNVFEITSLENTPYIDVSVSNAQIENIYMDIWPENDVFSCKKLKLHFFVQDEGNVIGLHFPKNEYVRTIWQTMYTSLDLFGRCNSFRIYFDDGLTEGMLIRIDNISFNVPQPFVFSKKRALSVFILLLLLYFLRPSSGVYSKKTLETFKGKKLIIAMTIVAQALLMWNICNLNAACKNPVYESQRQYELLAEALIQGNVYLMQEPPEKLVHMENPYSFQARQKNGVQDEIIYDVAYYNGHYYVYFGIGPVILFYIPYYLITGMHIPSYKVMFILGLLAVTGWMLLLYEMIRKFYKAFPFTLYLVCSFLFSAGCGLTYVISRPDFYAIPTTMGLVCSLFGLAFWLKSIKEDSYGTTTKIEPVYIFIGSFFMAYVAACRPQFLLGSFVALIIFFSPIFKNRILFSKKSIPSSICFVIPYIAIASFLMLYNYVRFNSIFDFGANYNLTFHDLTKRGFRIDRLLNATVGFMFKPAKVTNSFPYFMPAAYESRYQGYTSDEQLLGGLFYNHVYLLSIAFIPKARKFIKDIRALLIAYIMPVFALIIMIVDANMSGVLNRYFLDFSWLIIIPFFILLGYIITDDSMKSYRFIISHVFYMLAILSLIHMFFMIFGGDVNGLESNGIVVFEKVKHLIEFWN